MVLFTLERNFVYAVKMHIMLGLYKALAKPVQVYELSCIQLTRANMRNHERFEKRSRMENVTLRIPVLKWLENSKQTAFTHVHLDGWTTDPVKANLWR